MFPTYSWFTDIFTKGLCRGVKTVASIVVRVSVRVRVQWLRWTQEHKNHREDVMVYPGLGRSIPYIQKLMILILKSTQNQGLQQSV